MVIYKQITFHIHSNSFIRRRKTTCEANAASENLFHFIILSLPMQFYIWLPKNFSELTSKNGEIGRFSRSLLIESF